MSVARRPIAEAAQVTGAVTTDTAQNIAGVKTFPNGLVLDNGADEDFLDAIVLAGGKTTQYKRYLDFRKIDGLTSHRMGVNASNQFIVYDNLNGTHIIGAATVANGGTLMLNAQGSGAVNFNNELNSSNGGVHIYSGGATTPVRWAAIDGTGLRIFLAGVEKVRITQPGNIAIRTTDYGGGVGIVAIANAATVPNANPVGGGVLYVEAGALTYRGSSGTVTVIAPA